MGTATGVFRDICQDLPAPPAAVRERLPGAARHPEAHRAAMLALPCMTMLEVGGAASPRPLGFPFTVGAWNLERCLSPEPSADTLARHSVAVALLSELDSGMARTGQRNTVRALSGQLDLAYAYGVEFLELSLGNPVERAFCTDTENARGFHGNALLGPAIAHPFLVRLDDDGHWFRDESPEARIGGRCAIGGWIDTAEGPLLAVSAHMESDATPEKRGRAFRDLLDIVETEAGGRPVILGGDLNTGLGAEGDWRAEPLLTLAEDAGFTLHSGDMDRTTTRPSRITRHPDRAYKLDWILTRGVICGPSEIVPSVTADGLVLSDHDLVLLEIRGLTAP